MDPDKKIPFLITKRICDIVISVFLLIALSPLLLFLLLITAIDSRGSPILRQKRIGKNLKPFILLKFRSMKSNTPNKGTEYLTEEESQQYTTKWGRLLRKSSADELPQLFNILIGNMSLIGPRPGLAEGEKELTQYRLSYLPSAYLIKPGLTGYAQVKMRRGHDVKERARLDSYYVNHLSFINDLSIFFKSFKVIFSFGKRISTQHAKPFF